MIIAKTSYSSQGLHIIGLDRSLNPCNGGNDIYSDDNRTQMEGESLHFDT